MKDEKIPMEPEFPPAEAPPESGFYETGKIRPPKNHRRVVVALLVIYIVLGGLAGILTMLNISLAFRRDARHALAFRVEESQTTEPLPSQAASSPAAADGAGAEMDLVEAPAAVANVPQEGGLSLQEIYKKVAPSVVSISAQISGGTVSGSGVIMSENGYLITNCHVVEDASSILVTLADSREFDAGLVGADSVSDLAVLQIDATDLTPAEFGSSENVQVGDSVVAIGSPLGSELPNTMTDGIISAINRNVTVGGNPMTLLQTNAALNSGNSGGALVNCYGQVIGITTAKIGDQYSSSGVEGLGFAIPMSTAKEIVELLVTQGYVPGRPSLGMELAEMSALYSIYYDLPGGLLVSQVQAGSDAERVGIAAWDVLTQINGVSVMTLTEVQTQLADYSAGDAVQVQIYRRGAYYDLSITLSDAAEP